MRLERKGEPRIGDCTELDDCKRFGECMREGGVTGEFSPVEGVVAYRVEGDARRRGRLPPSQTECGFK